MRHFFMRQVEEAVEHAVAGGQALHTHRIIVDWGKAPLCFKREVRAGRDIAHLFDQDLVRLVATVRRLGVKVVVVECRGTPDQHVDLCGTPLRKAMTEAYKDVQIRNEEGEASDETCGHREIPA